MAEITKTNPDRPFSVPNYIWIFLGLLTVAAYLCGLNMPLVGPDEPRYAQVSREMLERGDWVTPTLGGHTWFEKPALLYWMEMASYKLFGVTEFAARLGPALCGLGTVAALWLLGRFLTTNDEQRAKNQLANWLAVITASTLGILVFSHGASFDIVITFTITAALVSFLIFDQKGKIGPLALFYLFIGLSLLAKGLIGIVFPFAIVAVYFVLSRRLPSRTFILSLFWGTLISVAVASIWYVPAYLHNGWPFIDEFIIQHHFQRFTSNKYQHPQPFYFFFWVLPLMIMPWLPFLIVGIAASVNKVVRAPRLPFSSSPFLFSLAWIAVPLVFFSLSGSKLPGYILPSIPGAVIITGIYVAGTRRVWQKVSIGFAAGVLVGIITLILTVVPGFADSESVKPLITAANERGFANDRVFAVHTTPQGTEFYTPGRLLRDADGNQRKIYSGAELKTEMERAGVTRALAIVTAIYPDDITAHKSFFTYELLATNGELAIYSVSLK